MGIPAKFENIHTRDEFFRELKHQVLEKLPVKFRHVKITFNIGDNWIKFRFPEFSYARYELQFVEKSPTHKKQFHKEFPEVVAFYLDNKVGISKSKAWLEALNFHEGLLREKLGKKMKLGDWNSRWAWVGIDISDENLKGDPEQYANEIVNFVLVTYDPISQAFQAMKQK